VSADRGGRTGPERDRDARAAEELAELLDGPEAHATWGDEPAGEELAELLSLASSLREVPAPRPHAGFRTALRERLVTEADAAAEPTPAPSLLDQVRDRVTVLRRSVSLAAASAACALLLATVGVVVAAQHAQPGDLLYGLKQTTESLRLGFAGDEVSVGLLHLEIAERRLGEVDEGARTLPSSTLIDTLGAMDHHTERGADLLLDAYHLGGDAELLSELVGFVDRQRAGLNDVIGELPVEAVPFAYRSLDLLDRIEHELSLVLFEGCVPCADAAAGAVGSGGAAARCCPDSATEDDATAEEERSQLERRLDVTEIDEDEAAPTPGSRLRGVLPLDDDVELSEDLRDTVERTTNRVRDTTDRVRDTTDRVGDTVDDVGDELDETVDDLTDDLIDDLGGTVEDLTELLGD
jgi:hypothetical protein